MRIAIIGYPKTGKTLLSNGLNSTNIKHSDDLIQNGIEKASEIASNWFNDKTIDMIEGVIIPKALQIWLKNNQGKPIDKIINLNNNSYLPLNIRQENIGKDNHNIFREIYNELLKRNVIID